MSTDQLKNTFSSADPRPVADRTLTTPGMSFIASSTGRVIVAIIWSPGITPLSIRITTRGKSVCGNTDDGIVTADSTPARHRQRVRNRIDFDCRTMNRLKLDSRVPSGGVLIDASRSGSGAGRFRSRDGDRRVLREGVAVRDVHL